MGGGGVLLCVLVWVWGLSRATVALRVYMQDICWPLYSCLVGRLRRLGAGIRESGGRVSLWVLPTECVADSRDLCVCAGWGRHGLLCISDGWWREVGLCCRALPVRACIWRQGGGELGDVWCEVVG